MPPFRVVDAKALGFHGTAQKFTIEASQRRASRIVRIGTLRHFIISARHLERLACLEVVESEVDGATTVVAGALGGIGDEDMLVFGSSVPEDFGDVPGAVGVVDEEPEAVFREFAVGAEQGFGSGALEEGAGLRVEWDSEEVGGVGVADIEFDGAIERAEFDEFRRAEGAFFGGRGGGERCFAKRFDGFDGGDAEIAVFGRGAFGKENSPDPGALPGEGQRFTVVQSPAGKTKHARTHLLQWIVIVPLNEYCQFALALEHIKDVVVPSIFTEVGAPFRRAGSGAKIGAACEECGPILEGVRAGDEAESVAKAAVGDEVVFGSGTQFLYGAAAEGREVEAPGAGGEFNGLFALAVASGVGGGFRGSEGGGLGRVIEGKAAAGLAHPVEGELGDSRGDGVGAIEVGDDNGSEFVSGDGAEGGGESVDGSVVRDGALAVEFGEGKAEAVAAAELRIVHFAEGGGGEQGGSVAEEGGEEEAEVGGRGVEIAGGSNAEIEAGGIELAAIVSPEEGPGKARGHIRGEDESAMAHSQGSEDGILKETGERNAGDMLEDAAGGGDGGIGILCMTAGFVDEFGLIEAADGGGEGVVGGVEVMAGGRLAAEAGAVREEMAKGDGFTEGVAGLKVRKVLGDRLVEIEDAFFHLLHDGDGGEQF